MLNKSLKHYTIFFLFLSIFLYSLPAIGQYNDLDKIGEGEMSIAVKIPDDKRYAEKNFSVNNYYQLPNCWSSIYYNLFPEILTDNTFIYKRNHYFNNLNLLFLKVGQTSFCKTVITPVKEKYFSINEATEIAGILAKVNNFSLTKIKENTNEIVYRSEKLPELDGIWLNEVALKKNSNGEVKRVIMIIGSP